MKRKFSISSPFAHSRFPVLMKLSLLGGFVALFLVLKGGGHPLLPQASCPNPPLTIVNSPQVPTDVCIPSGFQGNPIAFFDDFSWRSFIAMVWPAQQDQRGVANASLPVGTTSGPLVFETLKADWEIFQPSGAAPSDWNSFSGKVPCSNQNVGFNDLVLSSFTKFGNVGEAGRGNLVGPLVAQNNTYVRYLTAFNKTEFDKILSQKLYLRANLNTPNFQFDSGALDVKSAWVDMTGIAHPERYYTRTAQVLDTVSGNCSQKTVGLVGLHIVQKTPSRPQWIWSTFEQVDNIPQDGAVSPFPFNDGTGTPMPDDNPIGFPPPLVPPQKFNVQRLTPINPSTAATNAKYQQALASQGSGVWQFYKLVMTQWPTTANNPALPGDPTHTFPGANPTSAFANVTLETFDQTRIQTGCMNCHNATKQNTDFLWSLQVNAFPTPAPNVNPAINRLRALLIANKPKAAPTPKAKPTPKPTPKPKWK